MEIINWIIEHPLVVLLLFLCISVINNESDIRAKTLAKIGNFKFSALIAGFAAITFFLYHSFLHYEITREKFSDYEYDITLSFYSEFKQTPQNAPKIVVIGIDDEYLKEHNLSDPSGGFKYNITPRSVLANVLNEFSANLDGAKPRAVLLDYHLKNPTDINSTKLVEDDVTLINALNKHAKEFRILLPTLQEKLFIENRVENVEFVYTAVLHNIDNVARGIKPYICKDGKKIFHISKLLYDENLKNDNKCKSFDTNNHKDIFKHRIIYKELNENTSKYTNIIYYSANELNGIPEDFDDAIVLIGSNYSSSGDRHKTPIGDVRSGIFTIADAINTSFLTKGEGLKTAHWLALLIIYSLAVFVLTLSVLKITEFKDEKKFYKLKQTSSKENVIYIVNISVFTFFSAIFWFLYGYWLPWIVPILVFTLIDYGIFLIIYIIELFYSRVKII